MKIETASRICSQSLTTARVTCHRCGITTELDVTRLPKALTVDGHCKHCGEALLRCAQSSNPMQQLMLALEQVNAAKNRMRLDFSIVEVARWE